jgi:glycosyltransferase involved in cell wall biosynthesis
MKPKLSICIPTYNRRNYLNRLLKSIIRQYRSFHDGSQIEIVICDNSSTDGSEKMVKELTKKYPKLIKYIRNPINIGMVHNFRKSVESANGKYVLLLSDDDILLDHALKNLISTIDKHNPDFIWLNLNMVDGTSIITETNLLHISRDRYFKSVQDVYQYLIPHIMDNSFDWFFAYLGSCFRKNTWDRYKSVLENYNSPQDIIPPQDYIFLYHQTDSTFYAISESAINYRLGNSSWGSKNTVEHVRINMQVMEHNYRYLLNRDWIPYIVKLLLSLKLLKNRIFYYVLFLRLYSIDWRSSKKDSAI